MKFFFIFIFYFHSTFVATPLWAQFNDSTKTRHPARTTDERLFYTINHWGEASGWLDGPMKFLSNTLIVPSIVVPGYLMVVGYFSKNHDELNAGFAMGGGIFATTILQELIIKPIVARDRPYHVIEDTRLIGDGALGYSFPSSHAATSFGIATGLSLHYPKWYVIGPSYVYALLVTLSRPYLGAHYPTDLIVGAFIGSTMQWVMRQVLEPIMRANQTRTSQASILRTVNPSVVSLSLKAPLTFQTFQLSF